MAVVEMIIDPDTLAQGETYQKVCEILHLNGTMEFLGSCNSAFDFLYIVKNSFQFFYRRACIILCIPNQFHTAAKPDEEFCKKRL